MKKGSPYIDFEKLFQLAIEKDRESWLENERMKNLTIPNKEYNYAFIKGAKFENSFGPSKGDYSELIKIDYETISVWTHSKDEMSVLISEVDEKVTELDFFKNFGTLLQLSSDFSRSFENVYRDRDNEYRFIDNFDKHKSLTEQVFYQIGEYDDPFINDGTHYKLTDFFLYAPYIELLYRDDRAYLGVSLLKESMISHDTCLICELDRSYGPHHESHDLRIWEHASMLGRMESAIVQATRVIESLIGQPPNQNKAIKINRKKEEWKNVFSIDPNFIYSKSDTTFWEFYINLFKYRNPAAHSYGNINYQLKREETINVQCFAFLLLESYIEKNILRKEDSFTALKLNIKLLNKVNPKMSTPCTKDGDGFPNY